VTWEMGEASCDMGNGTGITWHGKQDKNHVTWETNSIEGKLRLSRFRHKLKENVQINI